MLDYIGARLAGLPGDISMHMRPLAPTIAKSGGTRSTKTTMTADRSGE